MTQEHIIWFLRNSLEMIHFLLQITKRYNISLFPWDDKHNTIKTKCFINYQPRQSPFFVYSHSWSTNAPPLKTANQLLFEETGQLSSHLITGETQSHRKWQHRKKVRWAQGQTYRRTEGRTDKHIYRKTEGWSNGRSTHMGLCQWTLAQGSAGREGGWGCQPACSWPSWCWLWRTPAAGSEGSLDQTGPPWDPAEKWVSKNVAFKEAFIQLYTSWISTVLFMYLFLSKCIWYIFITLTKGRKYNYQIFWLWNGSKALCHCSRIKVCILILHCDRSKNHEYHCWALGKCWCFHC